MATINLLGDLALDESVKALTGVRDTPAEPDQKGVPVLAVRRDSDSIPTEDGDLSLLAIDEEGRLKTSGKTASFPPASGNLTAVGNTLSVDVSRASNVVFHVRNTGAVTMAAGTFVFEGSIDSTNGTDGTWFSIQAVRSNANTVEVQAATLGIAVAAGTAYSWESSVNAYQWMRVRCTVIPTATSIATWTIRRGSYATEPIPAAQITATQPVSGTVAVTGTVGTTTATGTQFYLATAATTNATLIKSTIGSLFTATISNPTATPVFVKFYAKATAPVVGTDVPVMTIPVAAGTVQSFNFGTIGQRFLAGIGVAATAGGLATDTAAAVAGVQIAVTFV